MLAVLLWPALVLAVPSHAVVFMYHRFGDSRYPSTNVRMDQFKAQLDYFAAHGYQVWPLQRILKYLQIDEDLPDKVVAITIDDAYLSVYQNAFPVLKARNLPFTVFVSSGPVDRGLPDFMSWEQMREMQKAGASFANHSADHAHLVARLKGETEEAWRARVKADIEKDQQRLQAELGRNANETKLFAYPYGEYDNALAGLLKDMGYTAFGQQSGAIGPGSDRQRLPRYPINEHYAEMPGFEQKAASLPLPVKAAEPSEPVVGDNPPRLVVTLHDGDYIPAQLACYATGQGRIPVQVLGRQPLRFAAQAKMPFAAGRARYNCTAPLRGGGRWYWYSHPWLIPPIGGGPGD
jgi:biofilm PGA synthesis lipoprotein PgaB